MLRVNKQLLVIFLDGKNEPGRCLSHGQSDSVWDGKNIPTSRILYTYQSSTSQIIEEENSQFSRRISHVASTGRAGMQRDLVDAYLDLLKGARNQSRKKGKLYHMGSEEAEEV